MIFSGPHPITLFPKRSLHLIPFGEVQTEEEYERLADLVSWSTERLNDGDLVYMFGMGDYNESPSPSDRAAIRSAKRGFGFYEELAKDIEKRYMQKTYYTAQILSPLAGFFLGFLKGHHYMDLMTPDYIKDWGVDTDRMLAKLMNSEYWGDTVVLDLLINGLPFQVTATHGYGSARTPAARLVKRLRMKDVQALSNWYVMGHDNDKFVYPTQVLIGRQYYKQYFSGSGSFQRSYKFDSPEGTYAERLMLPPSVLGVTICKIALQYDKQNNARLDYHIST